MSFESFGLRAEILRAVREQGHTVPTPIQSRAIPAVLRGVDLHAGAQTGTGKTAAFVLPILHTLSQPQSQAAAADRGRVRALILLPTRELAAQVQLNIREYGKYLGLRSLAVFGGVGFDPQVRALRQGVDVLVATPGRLLDHASQRTVDLSGVGVVVLDEADRMLDMGFIPDIRRILALLPRKRQNLLFSATLSEETRRLSAVFMHNPELVEIPHQNATAALIVHRAHPVDRGRKRALLAHLIREERWGQVLVFTRTKRGADNLAGGLYRAGIDADAIHGDKTQGARTRTLEDFKRGKLRVLVATDVAARGLDIDQLPQVVNYDLPEAPHDYVHRAGRTGRAGMSGEAVSLVAGEENLLLRDIERLIQRDIEKRVVPGFEPTESARVTAASVGRRSAFSGRKLSFAPRRRAGGRRLRSA
jgi:ATP-dependent RNA helicase RhlE